MATAPPLQQPAPPPSPPAGGAGGDVRGVLAQFRTVALQIQTLATNFPEFQDSAAQILPLLMKGMAAVAGNAQRTPPTAAPPIGA